MKTFLFCTFFAFCVVSVSAQTPVVDATAVYGYKKLGTKKMVRGTMTLPFYGQEKTQTKAAYAASPGKEDTTKMTLGDKFLIDSVGLFRNYAEDGTAYLIEMPASLECFEHNGSTYIMQCHNLVELAPRPTPPTNLGAAPAPKNNVSYTHDTNVHHEDNITFHNNFDVVTSPNVVYVEPKLIQVQFLKTSYDHFGRRGGIGTVYDQNDQALVIEMTVSEFLQIKEFGGLPVITDAPRYTDNRLMWGRNFVYLKV